MTVTLTLPPDVENAIQEAARRQGQTPEEAINQALHKLFVPEMPYEADQRQRREVLADLLTQAQNLEPKPSTSHAAQALEVVPGPYLR